MRYIQRSIASGLIIIPATILLSAMICFYAELERLDSISEQPALLIPAEALMVGDVWNKQHLKYAVPISNACNRVTKVYLDTSCSCAVVRPNVLQLQPYQTRTIVLDYDLPLASPANPVPVEVTLVARDSSLQREAAAWQFRAIWRSHFIQSPSAIVFADLRVNGPVRPASVFLESTIALVAWTATSTKDVVTVQRINPLPSPNAYEIVVAPKRSAIGLAQELQDTLVLSARTAKGTDIPPLEIPIRLIVQHGIDVEPPMLVLGQHARGAVAHGQFRLVSRIGSSFTVLEIKCSDPAIEITCTDRENASAAHVYTTAYKVAQAGTNRAEVQLTIADDAESSPYVLSVPALAIGVDNDGQ